MADGIKIDGLSKWEGRLLRVIKDKAPKEYSKMLTKAGNLLMKNAAAVTPKDEGRLQASYKKKRYNGEKEWYWKKHSKDTIEAGTTVFYARMVEEGHRLIRVVQRVRRGRRVYRIKKDLGFVPGKFYFRKAEEMTERQLPDLMKELIHKIGKELGMDVSE